MYVRASTVRSLDLWANRVFRKKHCNKRQITKLTRNFYTIPHMQIEKYKHTKSKIEKKSKFLDDGNNFWKSDLLFTSVIHDDTSQI